MHDTNKRHISAGVYVCRVLYYEVHLLDDITLTLRQHSSGETGQNNENRKPSSLHDVFSLTATPTSLWFSNGKLKRIFHHNFIDLMWRSGPRCCRNANWPLLPPHLRAMAAGAAPCTGAKQNSTEITIQYSHTASHWASHTWFMHYTGVGVVQ